MPSNWIESYETFKKANSKLKEFIETDNGSEKDRNLITHTYKEDVATDIYKNIKNDYIELLEGFIKEYDKKIKKGDV